MIFLMLVLGKARFASPCVFLTCKYKPKKIGCPQAANQCFTISRFVRMAVFIVSNGRIFSFAAFATLVKSALAEKLVQRADRDSTVRSSD
jgi:hypothetical protein